MEKLFTIVSLVIGIYFIILGISLNTSSVKSCIKKENEKKKSVKKVTFKEEQETAFSVVNFFKNMFNSENIPT